MSEHVTVDRHWCLTGEGDRVVPEGHPDARTLHWVPGEQVLRTEAERLGALDPEPEAEPDPVGSKGVDEPKRRAPQRNKARGPGEDK